MFRLPPDPGNPDAQAKGLAPQRASAAPSRGAGSFPGPSGPYDECPLLGLAVPELIVANPPSADSQLRPYKPRALPTCRCRSNP